MQTVVLTGGGRGLGRATAQELAARGHRVVLVARTPERGAAAAAEIRATVPGAQVEACAVDLASMAAVRRFAAGLSAELDQAGVLFHIAGVLQTSPTRKVTADGFEETLAVNALAPFLLTRLLLPLLERSAPARIVTVSSRLHLPGSRGAPVDFDFADPQLEHGYGPERAYKNSKLAVLWFTYELQRRLPAGLTANAVCPGFVPTTAAASPSGVEHWFMAHVLPHMRFATQRRRRDGRPGPHGRGPVAGRGRREVLRRAARDRVQPRVPRHREGTSLLGAGRPAHQGLIGSRPSPLLDGLDGAHPGADGQGDSMAHTSPTRSRTVDVHMRETDSFSWTMERDPLLRMPIVVVIRLDGTPDFGHVQDRLERLTRSVPMFRQKVVEPPLRLAPPKWVVDADFDLSWHVRRIQAPTPATVETVLELARQIGTAGFDPVRPMWEATLVEGVDGGGSALVLKVHHTLTDGIGGMQLLLHVLDVGSQTADLGPLPPLPEVGTGDASLGDAAEFDARQILTIARTVAATLVHGVRHPRATATRLLSTGLSAAEVLAPANTLLSPVMTRRGLGRRYARIDVPLAGLKQAGRAAGGTVNDAFLGAVTGGLRRYHELHGRPVEALRVTLPISIRAAGDPEEGNRIALVRDVLPVGIADPVERIRADAQRAAHWKKAPAVPHMEVLSGAVNRLPAAYLQGLAKHVDFVASNVPGLPFPVSCGGVPVLSLHPFGPTGGSAVNLTLLTYRDTCHIGVNMDVLAIPDVDGFMDCMRAGFDEVLAVADPSRRA